MPLKTSNALRYATTLGNYAKQYAFSFNVSSFHVYNSYDVYIIPATLIYVILHYSVSLKTVICFKDCSH